MAKNVVHPYIEEKEGRGRGDFLIKGTRTRIKNLVAYYKLGYSAEELAREFPHLSLAKIYDALSYYHDHSDEIDRDVEQSDEKSVQKHQNPWDSLIESVNEFTEDYMANRNQPDQQTRESFD